MTVNGQEYEVTVEKNGGDYRVDIGGNVYKCLVKDDKVLVNGEVVPVAIEGDLEEGAKVISADRTLELKLEQVREIESFALEEPEERGKADSASGAVVAPMPGKIMAVKVRPGDTVKANQVVLVLEAMKMETEITAPHDGVVARVLVEQGESVAGGDALVEFQA